VSGRCNSRKGIPALPFINFQLSAKKPKNLAYPKSLTTLGDHIRKRRLDLGLWQKDVAATLGVTESTVTNWELNRVTPEFTYLPKIITFLGYIPKPYDKKSDNIIEQMKLYRLTHGLSQEKFSKLVGVDETTVAKWERGEHEPIKRLREKLSNLFP
jgi:DNA-binding transcriptional regulator YiaG